MPDVGVRAFKADVSGYLRRAAGGERVRVTSRGRAMVELVPIGDGAPQAPGVNPLDRLRESGAVTPARSAEIQLPTKTYAVDGGTVAADIVAERDRERRG